MTTYRFRVKYEYDPTSLWRDIVVGADRTHDEEEVNDTAPEVVKEKDEPVEQYGSPEAW